MVSMLQIQALHHTLVNPQVIGEMQKNCRQWNSSKTSLCDDCPPDGGKFFVTCHDRKEFIDEKVRRDF
jgi:hypothetical protein